MLTHFPLKPGSKNYSFLDQAVADLQQGLTFILSNSVETPELDTSLDKPHNMTSSVSSEFLFSACNVSDTSETELSPDIKCHKL